ncbi:MAG: hypothetical protein HYV33_00435 [Candidatus Kerfeldbacteria bacterium]|nr:hypothetical protein [Candidatus Kerfeldbacteria bacterium]
MQYVQVVPAIRSIRGKDIFTYHTTTAQTVVPGQLVEIPWRQKTISGVVWALETSVPAFATKPISKAYPIILPGWYRDFITWLAQWYYIARSHALKMCLPTMPKRWSANTVPNTSLSQARTSPPPVVQLYQRITTVAQWLEQWLRSHPNAGLAIIVPEENDLEFWRKRLQSFHPTTLTAGSSIKVLWQIWYQSLFNDCPRLVIGTKKLSLFPLPNYNLVAIIDPENIAHKQWDLNPRFQVNRLVEYWAKQAGTPVVKFSQAPRVEDVATSTIDQTLLSTTSPPTITMVDMMTEPNLVAESVLAICAQKHCPFLWLNKKGRVSFLVCRDCQTVIQQLTVTHCPRCRGYNLKRYGQGTTAIVEILQKHFPDRLIIELTDDQAAALKAISYAANPIIIGTVFAWKKIDWSQVDYVVALAVDWLLAQPDFRAAEHTLQALIQLRNFTSSLVIQTHVPDHAIFQQLMQWYPATWYQHELQQRQRYHFPPAGELISVRHSRTRASYQITTLADIPTDPHWIIDREL